MSGKQVLIKVGVLLCRVLVFVYDVITFPAYFIIDKPWKHWKLKRIVWSKLENEKDPYSPYVRQSCRPSSFPKDVYTLNALFENAIAEHGNQRCFGTREVLDVEEVTDESGKLMKKMMLGDYNWISFNEVDRRIEEVKAGLLSIGIHSRKPVAILAETRVEWIVTAQAFFRINVPVVTVYTTLGEDGWAHVMNETEVTHIITSAVLLPKLKNILPRCLGITHIVYMESYHPADTSGVPEGVRILSFSELLENGKTSTDCVYDSPAPNDLAIIMYTSGSVGIPKGVLITHKNLMATIAGISGIFTPEALRSNNETKYCAFLPLAHIYELICECIFLNQGVPVGFASPQTLTDLSVGLKRGCKGDISILQPTVISSVPLVLDRIRKNVILAAGKEGTLSKSVFDFAIKYKTFWRGKGFQTRLLNRLIFKKISDLLGGKLHLITSGGAPLSPDTQEFLETCLNVRVCQGYGMTESTAGACVGDVDDFSVGRVGAPLFTCKLRLVNWDEGGYHVTDVPHPRGEILIGGESVSQGYYKKESLTQETFCKLNGTSWVRTGDIGEVFPNGTFKIIDRMKDLTKLPAGEYISLGKIEAELKTFPLVDNICVIASGTHSYLVALVAPNQQELSYLSKELGKHDLPFSKMCLDADVVEKATASIREHGKKCHLTSAELPVKIKFCSEEWVSENGLVTASLKIRRGAVQKYYQKAINDMYSSRILDGYNKSP